MSSTSPHRARYSRPSATRRDSSDDERSAAPLTPPRPSFLASSRDNNNTNSWYSSSDPASDSDREIVPAVHPQSSSSVLAQQPAISRHARPRSTASSNKAAVAASYVPIDASDYANDESQLPQASAALRSATTLPRPLSPSDPSPPNSATATSHPLLHHQTSSTSSSYNARRGSASFPRSPPSAFPYPFQSHLGNPDPISATAINATTGLRSRQNSIDSLQQQQRYTAASSTDGGHGYINSVEPELERPYAPFMTTSSAGGGIYGSVPSPSSNEPSPRASTASFRAPFLSPASRPVSRPNSAFWSPPPTYDPTMIGGPGTGSSTPLPGPKPPLPSTLLAEKLSKEDKPWLRQKDTRSRASYWVTLLVFFVGVGVAALIVWRGYDSASRFMIPDSKLCAVFDDDFSSLDVDGSGSKWARNVSLNGFGNNEFEMTTNSDKNLFIKDGQLYIMPTLTTATGGVSYPNILDGGKYTLSGCTDSKSNCTVSSSNSSGSVIPPVQSARISTKGFAQGSIRYGKVEVSAKLPTGDWLWPAIWMLPVEEKYGAWPVSGEIDIMEARGNDISYAQGINVVRSTLNWGPLQSVVKSLYGWQSMKQRTFADGFHTYTLEWTDQFVKMYVDSRLKATVQVDPTKKSYWDLGDFPADAQNGSSKVALRDPYGGSSSAPFDQAFYLIINLSVGGTSGWFPDGVGGKPWTDAEDKAAIRQFALDQATWSASWPEDEDERAFRIDSVKMWKLC